MAIMDVYFVDMNIDTRYKIWVDPCAGWYVLEKVFDDMKEKLIVHYHNDLKHVQEQQEIWQNDEG